MNRIIKFRARSQQNGEWDYFDITNRSDLIRLEKAVTKGWISGLGQFTGLKDKNGKQEIYEGDLVNDGKKTYKVFWNELGSGGWWFAFKNKEGEWQHASKVNVSQLEVIGNIYKNKNLLK